MKKSRIIIMWFKYDHLKVKSRIKTVDEPHINMLLSLY